MRSEIKGALLFHSNHLSSTIDYYRYIGLRYKSGFNMQTTDIEWSNTEEQIAKKAFDIAYEREINTVMEMVRSKANAMTQLDEMWSLHDFLSAKRHDIDGKYDYKHSFLIFVFAQLVKEGWLNVSELEGLEKQKIAKISALSRMS